MFHARLPCRRAWKREGSSHAMWSYINDELGRERVAIFYKSARSMTVPRVSLTGLGWYVTKAVEHDGWPIIFDDKWATREAVRAAMTESRAALAGRGEADFRATPADTKGPRREEPQQLR